MFELAVLQLSDSAFPAGGFAHSFGFESLKAVAGLQGEDELRLRLEELAWHTGLSALPFLHDAFSSDPIAADRACDLFLFSTVANRASRAQGQAFLLGAEATFADEAVSALRRRLPFGHAAVAHGAALSRAGLALDDARQLFLFAAVRGACSAAVRLGVIGPLRAQHVLYGTRATLDRVLAASAGLSAADAVGTAPLLETSQGAHDRLYSRLFQS